MSYVAPDGNTYKYKISGQGSSDGNYSMDIYSNPRICLLNVSGDYRAIGLNSDNTACGWITAISGSHASRITGAMYPSTVSNDSCLSIIYYTNGSTSGIGGNWSGKYNVTYNSSIYVASSMEDAYAYLTAPEVFQIPSFSFSGSILPGQNSSLSQGSCSLASPYTTSFSFEGKCIEKYSAPNGQVYNYKYSYYGVMTYQGFTADFDVYSNIKIGVLSTDRRAYALYNGVKTQVDIKSAPAGTYTNASQGTSPNDDKVRYNGNAGVSNHIEHCYYSRSGANGYTLVMTQQDGYPVNFSTTFPTFATESALLEYLSS